MMIRRTRFVLLLLSVLPLRTLAYDFSAVAPSGQTLYYNIQNGEAHVTCPNWDWIGYTKPTGAVIIPDSVLHSGTGVKYAVTTIGSNAFKHCIGLTSVTIGPAVAYIGGGAFRNCTALTTVNFNADSCTYMGHYSNPVFQDCPNFTVLTMGDNVRNIPAHAFYKTPLVSVTIPDSVTTIGMSAFAVCGSLESLTLGASVSIIGDSAFFLDYNLSSLTIPNSTTVIGNYAFRRNEALTSVTIGNSVTTIGNGAFQYCEALANVILLSETAPVLGQEAFFSYNGNRYYHIPCGSYDSYYNGTGWVYYRSRLIAPPMPAFTVDVAVDNEAQGEAGITSPVSCDSTCIISATPQFGYHFSHWSNGSTANPDTLHLTGDSTVTAHFAPNTYVVSVYSNNDTLGYATGGSGLYLDTLVITATCTAPHHHFSHWDDGNTANPRAHCITGDTSFTAFFVVDTHTVTVLSSDTAKGQVSAGGSYAAGSVITLTATAREGYRFVQWQDGNTDNPRTITVEADTTYTAIFEVEVGIDNVSEANVYLYPNPTSGMVRVEAGGEVLHFEVYNTHGSLLHCGSGDAGVDLTDYAIGFYTVRVTTASGTSVHRVVKR